MDVPAHRGLLGAAAVVVVVGVAAVIGVSSTGRTSVHPRPTVDRWLHDGGSRLMKTLGDDFTALNGPDQSLDLSKMGVGCTALLADVRAAQAYAAVPDAVLETGWTRALALFAAGAIDCTKGSETQDYALIIKAANEISQGTTSVVNLTPRLNTLAGN